MNQKKVMSILVKNHEVLGKGFVNYVINLIARSNAIDEVFETKKTEEVEVMDDKCPLEKILKEIKSEK